MRNLQPLLLLFLLAACHRPERPINTREWPTLDYAAFTLQAPPGWKKFIERGVDSYIGGLTNGKDTLEFDYGWYSEELKPTDFDSTHLFASDTIDGFPAIIAIPKKDSLVEVELSMDLTAPDKLAFGGFVHDNATALAIFQSLRFSKGDSTRNSHLTIDQFAATFPKTGKSMFQLHCSWCHETRRIIDGPALTPEFISGKGNDSIYAFLTHRTPKPTDNTFHHEFSYLSRADIDQLLAYLKGAPQ
jgi:hypothetical protein